MVYFKMQTFVNNIIRKQRPVEVSRNNLCRLASTICGKVIMITLGYNQSQKTYHELHIYLCVYEAKLCMCNIPSSRSSYPRSGVSNAPTSRAPFIYPRYRQICVQQSSLNDMKPLWSRRSPSSPPSPQLLLLNFEFAEKESCHYAV